MEISFKTYSDPSGDVIKAIEKPLVNEFGEHVPPYIKTPYTLSVEIDGEIIGGLTGYSVWDWFYIDSIGVEKKHRGNKIAQKLMKQAEEEAKKRDCSGVWLHTITNQAPDFYRKMGYEEFGRMDNCPKGQTRFLFKKDF